MRVHGRTVLLTGAAGGLGREAALTLARGGARVLAVDIADERGRELEGAVTTGEGSIRYEHLDLASSEALPRALERLVHSAGGVDILINNAAVYPSKPLEASSVAEHRLVQAVNVDAHIACAMAVLPSMKARGYGRIINISSITFYGGWANLSPYVASKGALVGLTRAWARELGAYGITVNAVSPGAFPTDAEKIHEDPEGYARFVLEHQSVKRRGTPADFANAVRFLASEEASFITGQVLNVDGGWVMH